MPASHTLLPFHDLAWPKFEAFIFELLSSGLRIELPTRRGSNRNTSIRRVVRVVPYGGPGDAQRGIDFLATMDDGETWVFQAKLTPKFGSDKANAAVKKACREFPKAQRYFLLVSGTPTTQAVDAVRRKKRWEMWDGVALTAHFLRGIRTPQQIEIIGRIWPNDAERLVSQLYPLRDKLLVTADEFFSTWLKADRLFHHRSTLVGQTEVLDSLSNFLRDPTKRAFILAAPGGRGKSRLLRAFADRVEQDYPDYEVRFVDPLAPQSARPESLRGAGESQFVIVQDDAHRDETIRSQLLGLLAQTQGKIVFATRPQAVTALEQHLVRSGFSAHTIYPAVTLPKLKFHQYERLAQAELASEHQRHARFLAHVGRDCPLVITVGAALINRNLISADKFEDKLFQDEVFARFDGEELDRLSTQYPRTLVRSVLQTIAVLAPWAEGQPNTKAVATFVGCTELDLNAIVTQLEAGQLVVSSGRGRRVIPDLFADHLVYTACYKSNGTLSDFARHLAKSFATTANETLIRNLAEADWQAARYHQSPESLIDPFWASLWKNFKDSDFFSRGLIVQRWSAHSVYQPQRSLELAQLAMHLKSAPAPRNPYLFRGKTDDHFNSHHQVLTYIPGLLEPIAIYHDQYRERCLDYLLQLSAAWPSDKTIDDHNHPWSVVSRIAEFKLDHPISAPEGVLSWLEKRIGDPKFQPVLAHPNKILGKILGPIFSRHLDASYSEGNTFHISHPPISIEQTRHLRDRALKIIEGQIFSHGEIAALNAFPVVMKAAEGLRSELGAPPTSRLKRLWLPERVKAFAVFERKIADSPSKLVRWKVRTYLRQILLIEPKNSSIHRRSVALLKQLPLEAEIAEVAVLCSYGWHEFDEGLLKKGVPIKNQRDKAEEKWTKLLNVVAEGLILRAGTAAKLILLLESEFDACQRAGLSPHIHSILGAIGIRSPALAKKISEALLKRPRSSLIQDWCALIAGTVRFPDEWLERISSLILTNRSTPAMASLLSFLHSAVSGPTPPKILRALKSWAETASDKHADFAIASFGYGKSGRDPVRSAIASNLNLRLLTGEQLSALSKSIGRMMRYGETPIPEKLQRSLLREMVRVPELESDNDSNLLGLIAKKYPVAVLNLYLARIKLGQKKSKPVGYQPLPMEVIPLSRLSQIPKYAAIARRLLRLVQECPARRRSEARKLFQSAVLFVSPLGAELLTKWAKTAVSFEELEQIALLGHFDGSMLFLNQHELTLTLLRRGREFRPAEFPQWEARLASKMGPTVRSFSNGVQDKEQNYVAEEARKLLAAGSTDLELESFYRAVLKHEEGMARSSRGIFTDDD